MGKRFTVGKPVPYFSREGSLIRLADSAERMKADIIVLTSQRDYHAARARTLERSNRALRAYIVRIKKERGQ